MKICGPLFPVYPPMTRSPILILGVLFILTIPIVDRAAEQAAAAQNTQGTPQSPGESQDAGRPVVITEGQNVSTATGVQTQVFSTVLHRDPTDLEHATDPQTGRNFHWDSTTNNWVNSQTGQSANFTGYLCSTSGPSAPAAQGATGPQAPGGSQDAGRPVVITEGQNVSTATGVQTQVFSTVLHRDPTDPEHATDPQTGRNFHWDSTTNNWVNSQTGQSANFTGYLCSTSGPPPTNTQLPQQEAPQAQPPSAPTPPPAQPAPTQPAPNKSVSMSGFTPTIDIRGFGGASFINGNTPPTAGFDGAVLFPLGNHVLIGPTAGFQWVNSSIISSIGSMTAGSTFANTGVGFKEGNFGGQIGLNLSGWELGIRGGATVAGSSITQAEGFCGLGNATSPAGCTVTSSTTTHDTVTGPFVGGYISRSIFSHVGVFVEFDYSRFKDTKPNNTNPTGPSVSIFDLHNNAAVAGLVLSFGRHSAK